jgi:putative membrane protein
MMNWFGEGGYGMGHGIGWIFMILFWAAIIYLVARAISPRLTGGDRKDYGKSALDILKERYAKGDIDKEEYDRIKRDLQA